MQFVEITDEEVYDTIRGLLKHNGGRKGWEVIMPPSKNVCIWYEVIESV
ncbi:MAG: hypothetical protein ACK4F9_07190 [Brevinematia bacterium]